MARKADSPESEPEKFARWAREVTEYEKRHDELVPGSCRHDGDPPRSGPVGGRTWNGQARMALARREARGEGALNDRDREALARFPNPTGWVGEELEPKPLCCDGRHDRLPRCEALA